ncbi:hypothetical protein K438DRAFT_1935091 [Mycena galopus ATCC 62051]|nr:hypothetical protein K438DRAFT_1935091 [Mycena galopus ATCC 62051]
MSYGCHAGRRYIEIDEYAQWVDERLLEYVASVLESGLKILEGVRKHLRAVREYTSENTCLAALRTAREFCEDASEKVGESKTNIKCHQMIDQKAVRARTHARVMSSLRGLSEIEVDLRPNGSGVESTGSRLKSVSEVFGGLWELCKDLKDLKEKHHYAYPPNRRQATLKCSWGVEHSRFVLPVAGAQACRARQAAAHATGSLRSRLSLWASLRTARFICHADLPAPNLAQLYPSKSVHDGSAVPTSTPVIQSFCDISSERNGGDGLGNRIMTHLDTTTQLHPGPSKYNAEEGFLCVPALRPRDVSQTPQAPTITFFFAEISSLSSTIRLEVATPKFNKNNDHLTLRRTIEVSLKAHPVPKYSVPQGYSHRGDRRRDERIRRRVPGTKQGGREAGAPRKRKRNAERNAHEAKRRGSGAHALQNDKSGLETKSKIKRRNRTAHVPNTTPATTISSTAALHGVLPFLTRCPLEVLRAGIRGFGFRGGPDEDEMVDQGGVNSSCVARKAHKSIETERGREQEREESSRKAGAHRVDSKLAVDAPHLPKSPPRPCASAGAGAGVDATLHAGDESAMVETLRDEALCEDTTESEDESDAAEGDARKRMREAHQYNRGRLQDLVLQPRCEPSTTIISTRIGVSGIPLGLRHRLFGARKAVRVRTMFLAVGEARAVAAYARLGSASLRRPWWGRRKEGRALTSRWRHIHQQSRNTCKVDC